MTETIIDLPGVIARIDGADFLREPIPDAALPCAVPGIASAAPTGRPSTMTTGGGSGIRAGTIDLNTRKLREGGRCIRLHGRDGGRGGITDGRREIPRITVIPSEAETFRPDFLRSLKPRDLRGVNR